MKKIHLTWSSGISILGDESALANSAPENAAPPKSALQILLAKVNEKLGDGPVTDEGYSTAFDAVKAENPDLVAQLKSN